MNLEKKLQQLVKQNGTDVSDAVSRLNNLFDSDTFVQTDMFAMAGEQPCGVITGFGYIDGNPAYAFAQDPTVDGGAVGKIHTQKIKKIYEMAAKTGAPIIGIYDSKGVRLGEGQDALAGYGELLTIMNNLSGVVPQISVVLGTCAGISAMLACGADFVILSEQAEFFLTAPFVTNATEEMADGAGSASNALRSGVAHLVTKDSETALKEAARLVGMLPINNLSAAPNFEYEEDPTGAQILLNRMVGEESSATAVIKALADHQSAIFLQEGFGASVVTALATLGGSTVGIVCTNGGTLDPSDTVKIARFVRTCDAFSLPIVTLVDTEGFLPSAKAELAGSIRESAKLAHAYAEATCPKVSVVIGNAYGAAYIALAGKGANADIVMAWPNAMISALSPEASVEVLWQDKLAGADQSARAELVETYKDTLASPFEAAKSGYIDFVISPEETRRNLIQVLDMLSGKRVSKLPKKHGNIPL